MICPHCNEREVAYQRLICETCRSRNTTKKNPLKRIYIDKRSDAKKRNLEFTLTFAYFEKIAIESDLLNHRGRSADSLTIERKENNRGYTDDNVEIISKAQNVKNYWENWRKVNGLDEEYPF